MEAPMRRTTEPLSLEQIALIRVSWRRVWAIRELAAEIFYRRLFELDPGLAPLFRGDMTAQGAKLMAMLGMIVSRLDRLDELVPAVEALGRQHAGYGVEQAHYDTVGRALLGTLRIGLGDHFSGDIEEAWTIAYGTLAGVMKAAG